MSDAFSLPRCVVCDQAFAPDPYNRHHQRCCSRRGCRRELKQRRQRQWRTRKYATDPEFRARAKAAVTRSRRRARRRAEGRSPPRSGDLVLLGLAAQVAGSRNTAEAQEFLGRCADLGRRLEAGTWMVSGP